MPWYIYECFGWLRGRTSVLGYSMNWYIQNIVDLAIHYVKSINSFLETIYYPIWSADFNTTMRLVKGWIGFKCDLPVGLNGAVTTEPNYCSEWVKWSPFV